MNEELMCKISEAMDSEEGISGDPELLKAIAESPEVSRYAKHLSRLQRWMATWPVATPSDTELEALATKIEGRLGEKFSSDYTRAPDFEEDEELASVTSGLLLAGDLTKDLPSEPSESLELTMSAITELADRVNEEASAVALAKVPLKRGGNGAKHDAAPPPPPPSALDDLPAKKPALPKVPPPRGTETLRGNAHDRAETGEDAGEHATATSSGTTGKHAVAEDAAIKPPPPPPAASSGTTGKHAVAKDAAIKPPTPSKASEQTGKHTAPKDAKPVAPSVPKADAKPTSKPARTDERVSFPVPMAAPRLELIEGGAAKRASVPPEPKRGWLPGVLAAAAVALGVLGVGTLMTSGGADPESRVSAPAAATVAPAAAPSSEPSRAEGVAVMPAPPPASPITEAPVVAASTVPRPSVDEDSSGGGAPGGAGDGAPGTLTTPGAGGGGSGSSLASGSSLRAPRGAARLATTPEAAQDVTGRGSRPSQTGQSGGATGGRASPPAEQEDEARPAPAREAAPVAATASAEPGASSSAGPAVETLDRETVQSVMQSVEPAARACAGERHGTAQVDVVVQGSGRVTSATVGGAFQGSPEGSCIARAVRSARFPQFSGEPLRFRYPFGI